MKTVNERLNDLYFSAKLTSHFVKASLFIFDLVFDPARRMSLRTSRRLRAFVLMVAESEKPEH